MVIAEHFNCSDMAAKGSISSLEHSK